MAADTAPFWAAMLAAATAVLPAVWALTAMLIEMLMLPAQELARHGEGGLGGAEHPWVRPCPCNELSTV